MHFLLCNSLLNAQSYRIDRITSENGLPQSSIKDIVKDKYGFIWLSTEGGLVKLDGKNILTIDDNLANKRMWHFFGNPKKDSIYVFDESEKNLYAIHQRKKIIVPNSIAKKQRFNRYFKDQKYFYFLRNEFKNKEGQNANYFIYLNDYYYFLNKNYVYYHNDKTNDTKKINLIIKGNTLKNVFAIDNKMYFLQPETKKITVVEQGLISKINLPKEFLYPDMEIYWSATNNQSFLFSKGILYKIKQGKNSLELLTLLKMPKEIDTEELYSMYYDEINKKIYLGSLVNGLCIISLQDFTTLQDVSSLQNNVFYALLPYNKNAILAPNGKLFQKNGDTKELLTGGLSDKYSFLYDDQKSLYYKKSDELFIKNNSDNYKSTIKKKFQRYIGGLFYENGYYILSFEGDNGLIAFYKDNSFKKPVFTISTEDMVKSVKFFTKDSLLIGTASELYKFSVKTGKKILINKKPNFNIRTIYISASKKIWILTYGNGFYLLENDRLLPMPLDKKKSLLQTHCILEDKNGFFWMSSNHGLYKIKESILLKSKQKKTIPYYYFYDKTDGFITNEFNGGCNPCGNILEDSTFVFPSLQGIVTFMPNEPLSLYPNKEFYAERANINNKKNIYFNDRLVLERDFFRAEVFLDLAYYGNEANLDIRAKLNTEDSEWENISNERKFVFTNLPNGNYELFFKVLISADGKYAYKKINVFVKPYFYETWWFKLIVFVFILIILYLIARYRVDHLKKKNEKLEKVILERTSTLNNTVDELQQVKSKLEQETTQQKKLIGTISHDITTPIKYLSMTTEMLSESSDDDIRLKKEYLKAIHQSTTELYNFTQTLKEYAEIYNEEKSFETNNYRLNDIVENKIMLFYSIALSKNIQIKNNISNQVEINIGKNILAVIIHNLLDNAIKNSNDGTIEFDYYEDKGLKIIQITDEGNGMSKQNINYYHNLQHSIQNDKLLLQNKGLGLHLIIQFLQMLEAKIHIQENEPKGTIIKLELK